MRRHRTTARSILVPLAVVALLTGPAAAQAKVPRLMFPVVGASTFFDDYGAPRGNGRHDGIDIMARKKSLAVAVEAGTVTFWTTSWRAGCMLYLKGKSGTTYLYIHLNNDRTMRNDNEGGCKPGVAYARGLKSGARVVVGQPIAYVGDSGDADGIASHLHFEVHPNGGGSVNPYRHLLKAHKLLFAPAPGVERFRLAMEGTVVEADGASVALQVDKLRRYPGGLRVTDVEREVQLAVSDDTTVFSAVGALIAAAQLSQLAAGADAIVWTETQQTTLQAQLGAPLALSADRIALRR
jgi:hypothetical protein